MDNFKMKQINSRRSDYILWGVLAILMVCIIVYSINYGVGIKQENKELREAIIKLQEGYNNQYATMVEGANQLYISLKECRELND